MKGGGGCEGKKFSPASQDVGLRERASFVACDQITIPSFLTAPILVGVGAGPHLSFLSGLLPLPNSLDFVSAPEPTLSSSQSRPRNLSWQVSLVPWRERKYNRLGRGLGRCDEFCRCLLKCAEAGDTGNPGKLTPFPESQGGVGRALNEQARRKGLFQGVGGGDSPVDHSLSSCCGGCMTPYSVAIVPCLRLSDPVLLPGRVGVEGLPECGLQGLSFLCVTWDFGD